MLCHCNPYVMKGSKGGILFFRYMLHAIEQKSNFGDHAPHKGQLAIQMSYCLVKMFASY